MKSIHQDSKLPVEVEVSGIAKADRLDAVVDELLYGEGVAGALAREDGAQEAHDLSLNQASGNAKQEASGKKETVSGRKNSFTNLLCGLPGRDGHERAAWYDE